MDSGVKPRNDERCVLDIRDCGHYVFLPGMTLEGFEKQKVTLDMIKSYDILNIAMLAIGWF